MKSSDQVSLFPARPRQVFTLIELLIKTTCQIYIILCNISLLSGKKSEQTC